MSSGPSPFPEPQARELTAQEQEARSALCFQLHTNVLLALSRGREALWALAEALYDFEEQRGWLELGYETRQLWLADPEISMTRSTYHRMVKAWRVLRIERNVPVPALGQLELSKVDVVLPSVEIGKRSLDDALEDVKSLGWRDLRETYLGPRRHAADDEPPADGQESQNGSGALSGPVLASDGSPVEALLDADEAGTAYEHQLADEDELPAAGEYVYVARIGVWSLADLNALERVEPPPSQE